MPPAPSSLADVGIYRLAALLPAALVSDGRGFEAARHPRARRTRDGRRAAATVQHRRTGRVRISINNRRITLNATAITAPPTSAIPDDDPAREAAVARPDDDQTLPHWGVVGDTYTILISGEETAGRYTLIDMHVPTGGGPPPHRHDFEEMFSVLDGAVEVTFRSETKTVSAGETFNVPANAPHVFKNTSQQPARLLCMCSPPGQEKFFAEVGTRVSTRTEAPPKLDEAAQKAFIAKAIAVAPKYQTELLLP
jgi:mannose-6-phosphate isomerase-like protein (cupin superfamily)